jgi:hypothetical protein
MCRGQVELTAGFVPLAAAEAAVRAAARRMEGSFILDCCYC